MRQQRHQGTASSILNKQTILLTGLNKLELQVDLLDNDGQLRQSSSQFRDDNSMISSRRNLSRQSTPAPSDDSEQIQHQLASEEKQTSSNMFNQPPPIPPRPMQPSLFVQSSKNQDFKLNMCLKPTKKILKRRLVKVF